MSPKEMSPKSGGKQSEGTYFLYNRKGANCAFSVNQLYSLCFMLYAFALPYLYSILSNLYSRKVESPQENSPEELISYTNKKGAVCAFFVNQLYSLCFML